MERVPLDGVTTKLFLELQTRSPFDWPWAAILDEGVAFASRDGALDLPGAKWADEHLRQHASGLAAVEGSCEACLCGPHARCA